MNFIIRPWKESDLASLVKYADNWNIAKNLTDQFPFPYTEDSGKAFIENASKNSPVNIFAIDIGGEAAGGIGIHPQEDIHRNNAELGYWLAEPFWGRGVMTNAVIEIVGYAFKTFEIDRVFARPFGTNIASQNVLRKAGFILEGTFAKTLFKNGEYLDELVFAIRRENVT